MSNLLSANFARLLKSKLFWTGIIIMFVMGFYYPFMQCIDMKFSNIVLNFPKISLLYFIVFIRIIIPVYCSLFIGTEYSYGTIRNKIIVGHSRIKIYLANLLICSATELVMCIAYIISNFIICSLLFEPYDEKISRIIVFMLCALVLSIVLTSIVTFISLLIQNKVVSTVISMLLILFIYMCGNKIYAKLQEREFTNGGQMYIESTNEWIPIEEEPNPYYISGSKRNMYLFLNDFVPGAQSNQLTSMDDVNLWKFILYDCIIIITTTGFGLFFFHKKDLK